MSVQPPAPPASSTSPLSAGPNTLSQTTPFPNRLLDEVMPRLNDTQWRLLCVIVRQTLGWQKSREASNIRKRWDWLTREQLKRRTGRNAEALAAAIDALIQQGYIVARNGSGQRLATAQDRQRNQSRIYYSLSPELLQWLRGDNKSDDRQSSSRTIATSRPPCSKIEHRKIEHGKSNTEEDTPSSVYRTGQRKIEHRAAGKPNTTKQTLTKETNTKREQSNFCNERSFARSHALHATVRQVFGKAPATAPEVNAPETDVLAAASPQVRDFVRLFEELYAKQKKDRPRTTLSAADWQRLHTLLQKHPNLEWQPVLEKFFISDIGYITRHNHSVLAFLNLCNFFLLRMPGALGRDKTSSEAVRKESGWQRAIPLPPIATDKPNFQL